MGSRLKPAALVLAGGICSLAAFAQSPVASTPVGQTNAISVPSHPPAVRKFKAVDADNHTILINRPGVITLLIGTSEDSQDAARNAGKAMYPLQGRPDFQLIVIVDLRDSIAAWVPNVALSQMRSNLDREAITLKPYFLKNGNKSNPRSTSYVIADFKGTICPQLGWSECSDDLRGILFGADGRELKRWDKLNDFPALQGDVRAAIAVLDEADLAKAAAAARNQGTKLVQPPTPPPPLPPPNPPPKAN